MAVKIRLQRHGAKNAPFYRLVAANERSPRDGRFLENLGTYDPRNKKAEEELKIKLDRAEYWLSVGAQPSETARSLINRARHKSTPEEAEGISAEPMKVVVEKPAEVVEAAQPSEEAKEATPPTDAWRFSSFRPVHDSRKVRRLSG